MLFMLVAGVAAGAPSVASADAGLPMLAIVWPGMGLSLVPVIAIEIVVMIRMLKTPWARTSAVVAGANVVTTLVGVPLTWVVLVAVQMLAGGGGVGPDFGTVLGKAFAVTVQAPWLLPYATDNPWMVPAAALVLLVPFFFVSWLIEYWVARWTMRDVDHELLNRAVMFANIASYALLAVVVLGFLVAALV
jgi:hypothetical protein